jgi:hypothetical protein
MAGLILRLPPRIQCMTGWLFAERVESMNCEYTAIVSINSAFLEYSNLLDFLLRLAVAWWTWK